MTFDPRAALTVQQNETLNEFISKLPEDLTPNQRAFCDEACCLRYLRARDWDVKKSMKMLNNSLKWRDTYKPEAILAKDLEEEASSGKVYQQGTDKLGRPVVYMTPARNTSTQYDKGVKLLIYTMEKAVASMPEGQEQLIWFIDFKGYSSKHSIPINVAKETIDILSNQYPERLGACFFIDTPAIF
ncbi:hypothetical protein AKO1_010158 [Acrasis kona]|uniref:CRAL-TRIO domain-containing protein n=1 Tax=Acrasis kona TaxID=1008807 RepID=A0AAW2ZSB4_9EUKA